MDVLHGAGSKCRVPKLSFDDEGPKVGSTPLLSKTKAGCVPRPQADVEALLQKHITEPFDAKHLYQRLSAIAHAINTGDVALAAIATSHLRLYVTQNAELDVMA